MINRRVLDAVNVTQALEWSQVSRCSRALPPCPALQLQFHACRVVDVCAGASRAGRRMLTRVCFAGRCYSQRVFKQPWLMASLHLLQRVSARCPPCIFIFISSG
jgi:hypothetical protein